jgi:lactate dehydrogenase-like 2-hydroxyacid dehydrogenase
MPKIAVARRLPQPLLDQLAKLGNLALPAGEACRDKAELRELLQDADAALVTAIDEIDGETLNACIRLKLLCNIGVGYNNIDVAAATSKGIVVTNTPGAMDDAVADLVFGQILAVARRLPQADAFVRDGQWTADNLNGFGMGMDVSKKTLGIVGFGRIGQTVARRALGFEMQTLYCNPSLVAAETASALQATRVELDVLLARSDFVVLQVPYRPDTHHLIGAEQLSKMKPSAVLIHSGRGGVVDDAALAQALRAGQLAAAAVDCVEGEPAVHPELLACPNVLFSPHIGSATPTTRLNMAMLALKNLITGLQGGTPPNTVNR